MADQFIAYDPSALPGERLAPEVRTEIAYVAPSAVTNSSITTIKIADTAVTTPKIADAAVTLAKLATNSVGTVQIVNAAVTTVKIADNAVTPAKTTTGILLSVDSADAYVNRKTKDVTAAEYAAIVSPDPNTYYMIS